MAHLAGIALWFSGDDAGARHVDLKVDGVPATCPPEDGLLGRCFALRDSRGQVITARAA